MSITADRNSGYMYRSHRRKTSDRFGIDRKSLSKGHGSEELGQRSINNRAGKPGLIPKDCSGFSGLSLDGRCARAPWAAGRESPSEPVPCLAPRRPLLV